MLPAAARLRRRADFTAAVRGGRRAGSPTVVAHLYRVAAPLSSPQVGFVVSTAVGGAVVRNRVRRQLRHLVRARLIRVPADSHLVVRATPAAAHASGRQLSADLDRVLSGLLDRAAR